MTLIEHICDIRTRISTGCFSNEASVSQGIVLRLLNALGWPAYDIGVVCPEYTLSGRRVDFALCGNTGKPLVFIEVKQIGKSAGSEQQLFEYAFHEGVQFAVLTDGQEWNFFLPAEQGNYGERRVYRLDIVEREASESEERLVRYLEYSATINGDALAAAREDMKNASRLRQMKAALPKAWTKLIETEDELLVELIADCVADMCGFKPEPDMVAEFLKGKNHQFNTSPKVLCPAANTLSDLPALPTPQKFSTTTIQKEKIGFSFNGAYHPCRNGRDVLTSVFLKLAEDDPTFFTRFAGLPKHGRTRRFLAENPQALYPDRPDLSRDHSTEIAPGWWLGTNVSKKQITIIIEMACRVAGVPFGSALTVNLG
jgi:hypothetical protein